MSIVPVILTLVLAWLVLRWLRWLVRLARCMSIPTVPGDRWLGGHLWMYKPGAATIRERVEVLTRTGERLVRINSAFGLTSWVALLHPDLVADVMNTNIEAKDDIFPNSSLRPLLGNSLLMAGGQRWRRNRKLLKTAFGRRKIEIRRFFDVFSRLSIDLVAHWNGMASARGHRCDERSQEGLEPASFVVDEFFSKLAMESILRCAFSLESNTWIAVPQTYGQLIDEFFDIHAQRFAGNPLNVIDAVYFNMTSGGRRMKSVCERTKQYVRQVVAKRRKAISEKETGCEADSHLCMLDILLEVSDPQTGEGLSEEDLIYESNLFLVAGYDTTKLTMTWLLFLLASHPSDQARCREEIDLAFANGDILSWESLGRLDYLTRCIKETLRLYPPIANVTRILPRDTVINGFNVPAGTIVSPNAEVIHRRKDLWTKPDKFYPDHFSPKEEEGRHPNAFFPFATGPRRCLGEHFALVEIKTVMAYLLRNFTFVADPSHPVKDVKRGVLMPENGIKVFAKAREDVR